MIYSMEDRHDLLENNIVF